MAVCVCMMRASLLQRTFFSLAFNLSKKNATMSLQIVGSVASAVRRSQALKTTSTAPLCDVHCAAAGMLHALAARSKLDAIGAIAHHSAILVMLSASSSAGVARLAPFVLLACTTPGTGALDATWLQQASDERVRCGNMHMRMVI
jgi:hypothetical protein